MLPAPRSERCSLPVEALTVTAHLDGVELRFGPGPAVDVFPASLFEMRRHKLTAAFALALLNETLAKAGRKDA